MDIDFEIIMKSIGVFAIINLLVIVNILCYFLFKIIKGGINEMD